MISSVRNFSVRILDADRFTIVIFQILDIKSNYLPGIVHDRTSLSSSCCVSLPFVPLIILLRCMNSAHVSLSHKPVADLALLGPVACFRTTSYFLYDITFSLSSWFSSQFRLSAFPLTHSYVISITHHQFSCRSLMVLTKS
jgi:hypothetical protein